MGKLSKRVFQISWDVAIRMASLQDQLISAYEEISNLKSLLASRDSCWEIAARLAKLQDKLHWAKEQISNLE